jgi:hypothetical protein
LASNQQVTPATGKVLSTIVRAGVDQGRCKRVWLTIGAAVDPNNPQGTSTFTNINNILTQGGQLSRTLLMNFSAIVAAVGGTGVDAVGIDMDYEEGGNLASIVANVTIALSRHLGPGCPVTFCPFAAKSDWINALQQVYSTLRSQLVVGFNLQTYAGGSGNKPPDWTAAVKAAQNTGVPDPGNFIWPIVSCDPTAPPASSPGQATQNLKTWGSRGASLWATAPLPFEGSSLGDYSRAFAQGIG